MTDLTRRLQPDQVWPWKELNDLADRLIAELKEEVTSIMREAGEDPGNKALYDLRCAQVAWNIKEAADRERRSNAAT